LINHRDLYQHRQEYSHPWI